MASRLDKLFELLESNHQNIRNAAAIQIGQTSASNQVNISTLLTKLLPYVKHRNWAVRIAAADAVRHIGNCTRIWKPQFVTTESESNLNSVRNVINLQDLNLHEILNIGTRLYSKDMKDLDETNANENINGDELARHLGFLIPDECEINSLVTSKDCKLETVTTNGSPQGNKMSVELAVEKYMGNSPRKLLKRPHEEMKDKDDVNEPEIKLKCVDSTASATEWPWGDFCDELLKRLWDAKWEIRHGAATCLRELIRSQGSIMIGRNAGAISSDAEFAACHERFQEEIVMRLLCTLTLDQLSDFVSDEMVAPVRESCAQALGIISVHLSKRLVEILANQLLSLLNHGEWRVNHGALLGLKYLLAARMDLVEQVLLPLIYDPISSHLKGNCDDDVRCAAVAALMPLFGNDSAVAISNSQLDALRTDLWGVLAVRIDYCTASGATCAVLQLLEKLYDNTKCNPHLAAMMSVGKQQDDRMIKALNGYINRLHWCYYNYSDQVRLAALRTCRAVIQSMGAEITNILEHTTMLQVLSQLLQRVLIDDNRQVAAEAHFLWNQFIDSLPVQLLAQVSFSRLEIWMCCAMQPARLNYSTGLILMPDDDCVMAVTSAASDANADVVTINGEEVNEMEKVGGAIGAGNHQILTEFYIGGRESFIAEGSSPVREDLVLRARLSACQLLAGLCQKFISNQIYAQNILISIIADTHLKDRLAVQRFVAGMILAHCDPHCKQHQKTVGRQSLQQQEQQNSIALAPLQSQLLIALEEPIYYQEILPQFKQMHKACRDLILIYIDKRIPLPSSIVNAIGSDSPTISSISSIALNISQCQSLISSEMCSLCPPDARTTFSCATSAIEVCAQQHASLCRLVDISICRALLQWGWLPSKLTPLIKPLISALRSEVNITLQMEACFALAQLVVDHNSQSRLVAPIMKLVNNIIQYQSDAIDALARWHSPPQLQEDNNVDEKEEEIVSLCKISQLGRETFPRQEDNGTAVTNDNEIAIKLRGARLALEKIYSRFVVSTDLNLDQSFLLDIIYHTPMQLLQCPSWGGCTAAVDGGGGLLDSNGKSNSSKSNYNAILAALRAMNTCLPFIKPISNQLQKISLTNYAQSVFHQGLSHNDASIRHWSARVLVLLIMPQSVTDNVDLSSQLLDLILLGEALKALESMSNEKQCYGAIELLYMVCHSGLLQYRLAIAVIVLPVVLTCLNAPFDAVRRIATHIFSLLLTLLPLESSGADLSILTPTRQQQRKQHLSFLDSLLNPKLIAPYNAHHNNIAAKLRHYQEEGVNWLAFLNRYGLHGVLADDMGLGKTLQTICVIAGEYSKAPETCPPSLIVCPPTLTDHWKQEIERFVVDLPDFNTMIYTGTPTYRQCIFNGIWRHQIIITSYETLRSDVNVLARPPLTSIDISQGLTAKVWNYVVLDEGHLIRNYKSKVAISTKALYAKHRLVLTGTPIQNRVGELWSIFDFLMPGLLGTRIEFNRRYGRVLEQNSSSSGRKVDSEVGTLALELLHRQVLPFMLRRVKDDVLQELPPKIMQDYICTMTPLQLRLYTHCIESQKANNTDFVQLVDKSYKETSTNQHRNGFQAMHYLRLVCNHPQLGLTTNHPLHQAIMRELAANNQSLDDINLSGKLVALRQLILDCGIGGSTSASEGDDNEGYEGVTSVVASNRLLVFCQSVKMIELVEKMIRNQLPKATHLRLDGSIPVKDRQHVVDQFSCDASIDILLLTTGIGGLGLNLTSANIVIFVEHDWNPMRDLQAMDRAHRIGQNHTVIVYRLITAQSIEEKIMNLQEFKKFIANAVVSKDNQQMGSMNTENILEIMNKDANWSTAPASPSNSSKSKFKATSCGSDIQLGLKSVLSKTNKAENERASYDCLDEYDQEYNLDSFVKKL